MSRAAVAFVIGFIVALCACSRQKTLSKDELRSQLTSAKSLTAETEMFLDYLRQHRPTKPFARGHVEYLTEEAERAGKELQGSSPAPGEEAAVQNVRAQFAALSAELHAIRGSLDDDAALGRAQ